VDNFHVLEYSVCSEVRQLSATKDPGSNLEVIEQATKVCGQDQPFDEVKPLGTTHHKKIEMRNSLLSKGQQAE
jgi:hypothetical protein